MNFKILRKRNFLLLTMGKFISLTGTLFQDFALSLYVLKITGSGTKFASVLAVALIPQLIIGPLAGVIVDWVDRRKTVIWLDLISGITVLGMGIEYLVHGKISMSLIYFGVIILSLISVIFNSASSAIIPSIMKKDELVDANSINSIVQTIAQMIGPILAGILYGFYGLLSVLLINSLSFFISAIFEIIIKVPNIERNIDSFGIKQFLFDFKEGIEFIMNKKNILFMVICAFVVNFALNPLFSVGFIYVLKQTIKISDFQLGVFNSLISTGMLLGSFFAGSIAKKNSYEKIVYFTFIFSGILIGIMALVVSPLIINTSVNYLIPYMMLVLLSIVLIATVSICNISIGTMFQTIVPIEMLGRTGSVLSTISMAAIPIGQMIFGMLFDYISAYFNFLIVFIIITLTGLCYYVYVKRNKLIVIN